jgi:hypothetical protein
MPLQEGKTARGQMEKIRLYHTICVVREGFRNHTASAPGPVIFTLPRSTSKMRPGRSWTCSSVAIPKSPVEPAVNSGHGEPQIPVATGDHGREHHGLAAAT